MSRADVLIRVLNDNDHNPEFEQAAGYDFEVAWAPMALVGVIKVSGAGRQFLIGNINKLDAKSLSTRAEFITLHCCNGDIKLY